MTLSRERREGRSVDPVEVRASLATLWRTGLARFRTAIREDLRTELLDALARPGAAALSPAAIVREIVRKERERLEVTIPDRSLLRAARKALYEELEPLLVRIARTETANATVLSQLLAFHAGEITTVTWSSHTQAQGTCATCLALDGTEHPVEDLLVKGRYPLSSTTHDECRCFLSPVIPKVTLQSMERLYVERPDIFVFGQSVSDRTREALEELVREYDVHYGVHDRVVEGSPTDR